jgi:predicted dienelactone hydrolase
MPTNINLTDPTRRSWSEDGPRPVRLTVWEPEQALHRPAPLALLSHGTGGSIATLDWLGESLSSAGWLVVGVDHHGNSAMEPYLPQGFGFIWERPRDLRYALEWAMNERAVDGSRIAAVGYSLGGYSVAALAGARLNPDVLAGVLKGAIPVPPLPEYPTLVEDLRATYSADQLDAAVSGAGAEYRDPRVGRIVMLAPAVGQVVAQESLAEVRVPTLVLWGADDVVAAPADNALAYVAGINGAVGREVGAYGHGVFRSDVAEEPDAPTVRASVAAEVLEFLGGAG